MQTIYEADIHDAPLWHEYQGYRLNTRIQNPRTQWKPDEKLRNLTPAMVMKSRSKQELNDLWRAKNPCNRGRCCPGTYVPNHSANNNVWQANNSARVATQNVWTTVSNQRANKNVWQETDSDIEETDVDHIEQFAEKFMKQLERSKRVRKCSSFKQAYF